MIPAEIKVNIYRNSTNGFVVSYVDSNGDDFSLASFTKIDAVLYLGSRFNATNTFSTTVGSNTVTLELTPEQTEDFFIADNYRFELRFYTDATNFSVYTVINPTLLDVYNPTGTLTSATVEVSGQVANTVQLSESVGAAALAIEAQAGAETAETNAAASASAAATSETNAATSETNAATSASNASDDADDAEKHAQNTTSFLDSEGTSFDKGAKGWSQDAEAAKTAAETAQTGAETAESNAQAAQTAAETAETNAETAETNAQTSANAAATSESNAATSETNAAASASAAATSETNAQTAQTAAEAAQTAAETAQAGAETAESNTETLYDNFDDRYLGAKVSDPSTDNDGNTLLEGALYFNTTDDEFRVWNGSAWQDVILDATLNTDTDVSGNSWVLDEDDMSSNDATKVPTQQSTKAYVDSGEPQLKDRTEKSVLEQGDNIGSQNNDGSFNRIDAIQMAEFVKAGNDGDYPTLLLSPTRNLESFPETTFSRNSTKTYFDSDRILKEAPANELPVSYDPATGDRLGWQIEESRTNLLQASEDFSLSEWDKFRAFIDKDLTVAKNNIASADKLIESTDLNSHLIRDNIAVSSGVQYACSLYVKSAGDNRRVAIGDESNGGADIFDIETESVITNNTGTARITDEGGGWYRISNVITSSSTTYNFDIRILQSSFSGTPSGNTYTGDGTSGVYIWGAQLEQGATVSSYISSTLNYTSRNSTATYFDENGVLQTAAIDELRDNNHAYIDGEWVKTGPLLEDSSTNVILDSRDMTTGNWSNEGTPTVAKDSVGIDGVANTACTVTDDDGSGVEGVSQTKTIPNDSNIHTAYAYIAKDNNESRFPELVLNLSGGSPVETSVQINTKTGASAFRSGASETKKVEDYGDWWKLTITRQNNSSGNTTLTFRVRPALSSVLGGLTLTTGSTIFDQAQVELNTSQPSTPIITSGSQVTRAADVYTYSQTTRLADDVSIEGQAFTDFYNQEEGTLMVEFIGQGSGTQSLLSINNGGSSIRLQPTIISGSLRLYFGDGTFGNNITTGSYTAEDRTKFVFAYDQFNLRVKQSDNTLKSSGNPFDTDAMIRMDIGSRDNNAEIYNGFLKRIIYYRKSFTDSQVENLTTL